MYLICHIFSPDEKHCISGKPLLEVAFTMNNSAHFSSYDYELLTYDLDLQT